MKRATETTNKAGSAIIKIEFKLDKETLEQVHSLEGRKYFDTLQGRYWTCPLTVENIRKLANWGFDLDDALESRLSDKKQFVNKLIKIPTLKGELFKYQETGVAFLEYLNGRAIIGDSMGLGKTAQALAWLELRKELRPVIIVVPASLKLMWRDEAIKWMSNPKIQVLFGRSNRETLYAEIIIVNYEIIANRYEKVENYKQKREIPSTGWIEPLIEFKPSVLVIDEVHSLANPSAYQTKAVLKLGKKCKHVVGLGGTPIINRPIEGYNAIKLINPTLVPASRFSYGMEFCNGHHNGFGWDFSGASNTDKLNKILSQVMIRRLKEEVLPDLPKKLRSVIPMEITNSKEYFDAEDDFIEWVRSTKGDKAAQRANRAKAFTRIEVLKQIVTKGKLKSVIAWIDDYLESGNKLVLFCTHRSTVDSLFNAFSDISVKLVGAMSVEETHRSVSLFQNNKKIRLLIGTIDSRGRPAGVGHTLTAAPATAFVEMPMSPGIADQCEDRVLRIGQKADSVNAYYLVAEKTIEVKIAKMLDSKRKIVDAILDGKETSEDSLLIELLESYMGD